MLTDVKNHLMTTLGLPEEMLGEFVDSFMGSFDQSAQELTPFADGSAAPERRRSSTSTPATAPRPDPPPSSSGRISDRNLRSHERGGLNLFPPIGYSEVARATHGPTP